MQAYFVADVGGTNIRIATWQNGNLVDIRKMLCSDYDRIEDAFAVYFSLFTHREYVAGCIAIAGPVEGDQIRMINHSWRFSCSELKNKLKLAHLYVINDFTAVAHSLPVLKNEQLLQIGQGNVVSQANAVVFGPGTGLGVEHMTHTEKGWKTLDGEGGHVDFAPTAEDDIVVWRYLVEKFGRASTEEVLSGRGLVNIYQAFCLDQNKPVIFTAPAQITSAAVSEECAVCRQTLDLFCRVMGSFAGNLALNLAARGGIFIGGGIVTRFTSFLMKSHFRSAFEEKGMMKEYVQTIPTFLITEPEHGLLGAAAYLNQQIME